ncbi:MAG: 16S rRNA (guanine(527)-N(7))-methyltransferase RsmG [Clostridia bacterium]|nr:16S rRNA (guanine(527)-N(7))-methyltransferase RsmG [Clostridia bacterium]
MEKEDFFKLIEEYSNQLQIKLNEKQKEQFYNYMKLLIEWNEKINLTAIVEPKEIVLKHFVDSLTISKYIKENSYIADVGTGAGFPGIPLKILRTDIKVVLVDSLNKRIKFLDEVINKLELSNIKTIHSRAEEFGQNKEYREKFDIVTSRAVANLATLSEYLLPLAKIEGKCLCMKGPDIEEEIKNGENAIEILGGTIENIYQFNLPQSDIKRTIIEIEKIKNTNQKYPRKAGTPAKEPL